MKSLNVPSWHHQTPERRHLKRNRLGPADVYPQDPKQEEDNLGAERLKKGYQVAVSAYEHDSIVWNAKFPRLEKLDDTMVRGAQVVMQVLAKKLDLNATFDKDRRRGAKDNVFQNFSHTAGQGSKSKERKEWFTDLARGKSLASLARRIPAFRKKEDALEYLCDYKVPVARALWFLKLVAVGQGISNNVNKQKKSTNDQLATEHSSLFTKFVKCMLTQMSDSAKLETNIVCTDRWPYFVCLCKHAYEDGMIERQDFLMELCDILAERFVRRPDKPHFFTLFRLFLSFFAQYIDQLTQSLVLARRCAFLVAKRLAMYKKEADECLGRSLIASEVYEDMLQCQNQRVIVLVLTGMLHAILIDCPGALVWNYFQVAEGRPPPLLHQLCGSPLDLLPCSVEELPLPPGHGSEKIQELIRIRVLEVKRRSRAVENRWSLNQPQKVGFGKQIALTVQACLEILGCLDSARYDQPRCIERIYNIIFNGPSKEKFEHEDAIRVKMLLQWAVTVEREGTHRAITVASVLALRVNHRKGFRFGEQHLQDILLEYLDTEGPQPSQPNFHEEFANLMHLFVELQRARIFSHDSYVKGLITTGEMSDQAPIMNKVKSREEEKSKCSTMNGQTPMLATTNNNSTKEAKSEKGWKVPLVGVTPEPPDEHPLLGPDLTAHERFLIHLPIPQTSSYRSECNQRALLLHGIGEQRDTAKNELKKIAREITKIWTKRIVVEFSFSKPSEIRFKKRANKDQINEALQKFRSQTYYDQLVLCGWCCDNLISVVSDFAEGRSIVLPTAEGFDILLGMMEHCRNIYGIMELAEELLPLLVTVEHVIADRKVDCVPSNISTQLGYVLVAYITHNYYYFLQSENAAEIVSGLYRVVESQLRCPCLTGWGRSVAIFVWNAKKQLIEAELTRRPIEGKRELLVKALVPLKFSSVAANAKYNSQLFHDVLQDPKRMFSFNEYRKLNGLIESNSDARHSFVICALLRAHQIGNDYERLVELANMCSHLSIPHSVSAEWCAALQALCCSSVAGNHGFPELILDIDVEDSKNHQNIATFYMLLASRNCFSMNALFHQLLQTALSSLLKSELSKADVDAEAGVCLALLVVACMVCQSDEPVALPPLYTGDRGNRRQITCQADKWALSLGHLHDISESIFDLLFTICILADYSKNKLRDRLDDSKNENSFRREYIAQLSKAVLMAMCEQDWVTLRVYRVCEETNMDVFNSHRLRKNCLGQQLLRMALRRKCERGVVQELTVCNGNSKKSLIDKLFAVLNIWNIRATYFDLKLMIKEISPEGSTSKHAQQGAIAADALIGEIGKCCRDLFTSSHRSEKKLPDAAIGKAFRLKHITNYWLISPLVHLCPKPGNLPSSFPTVTVQAKFLREAGSMLDTANDSSRERVQQSAWLLSQEPFLNFVLTCLKGEEQQRDGLVGSLLKQLQDVAAKAKENPTLPYLRKFSLEREGLLLRLSLVGGMFDSVCHPTSCDSWALLFFQLMLFGVISRERDRFLFESCYDMLSTLLVWSITDPMNALPVNSQDPDTKYRYASYSGIVKKLRKELNERALMPELRSLMQFLPIPKPCFELITCEPYGAVPVSPQKLSKGQISSSPSKPTKQGLQFGEKVKLSAYDMIQNFNSETSVKRAWTWAMFQAVKLDRCPVPVQRHIQRLIQHSHYSEFVRPTICGMDRPPHLDIYLSPPTMDVSETPVSVHHVSSAAATTTTSTPSVATSVPASVASVAPVGSVDMQAASSSSLAAPQCRTLSFQNASGQMAVPQASNGDAVMFSGPAGAMQAIPDVTRTQANTSPRGSRGGRRKNAAGPSSRSQGTTRKKQQRQQAAEQLAAQNNNQQISGQQIAPAVNPPASAYGWTPQQSQNPAMQQFPQNSQPGAINQPPEDSKMKIHSMILKRQALNATSTQGYQNMGPSSSSQFNPMMIKIENQGMQMDHQQSYPGGPQQMQMPQDQQGSQFTSPQQRVYNQAAQQNAGNVFDTRMMTHQQQQQMQYSQQQYQPQY